MYFVVETFPEKAKIVDFTEHDYDGKITPLNPSDVPNLPRDFAARDYAAQITSGKPILRDAKSRLQLVKELEGITEICDVVVDGQAATREEFNAYSGTRDNIRQLIGLLQ